MRNLSEIIHDVRIYEKIARKHKEGLVAVDYVLLGEVLTKLQEYKNLINMVFPQDKEINA